MICDDYEEEIINYDLPLTIAAVESSNISMTFLEDTVVEAMPTVTGLNNTINTLIINGNSTLNSITGMENVTHANIINYSGL